LLQGLFQDFKSSEATIGRVYTLRDYGSLLLSPPATTFRNVLDFALANHHHKVQ
jgi:hypothetical protein